MISRAFSGRRALVVGGSGGIGRAVALGLAERGAALTISGGTSREGLDLTLSALAEPGKKAALPEKQKPEGFLCKIGGRDGLSAEEAAKHILERAPEPDILVCAWGPFKKARLVETDMESWRFLTESNLIFPGILVSSVLKTMLEKGWGRILLFGGTGTAKIQGWLTTAAYSAAKTALGTLAKSAARAGAGRDVTCNVLCPGLTDTEYCGLEEKEYNRVHSPGGKALNPETVAAAALAILEDPRTNGTITQL